MQRIDLALKGFVDRTVKTNPFGSGEPGKGNGKVPKGREMPAFPPRENVGADLLKHMRGRQAYRKVER